MGSPQGEEGKDRRTRTRNIGTERTSVNADGGKGINRFTMVLSERDLYWGLTLHEIFVVCEV